MDTIFMNSKNSEASNPQRLLLYVTDKTDLRRNKCCFIKSKQLLYMEKYKKTYMNNKFKISSLTWNKEFELPNGSYSISDIQNYFEDIY